MKRRSGRGRKPSNPANRSYESNGPDVKIRGNANQIYDKYLQYARDAQTSGDRIAAEAYFQHAEHYFRIMMANQPKERPPQDDQQDGDDGQDNEASADDQSGDNSERQDRNQGRNRRNNRNDRNRDRDRDNSNVDEMKVVDGEGDADQSEEASSDTDEGERKDTRRRRPSRRRRNEDEGAEAKAPEADDGGDDDAGLRAMMARSPAGDLDTDNVEAVDS